MKTNNVLLLVGDNKEELESFESKLMLLRDVDTILHSKIDESYNICQTHIPDTVVIFIEEKDQRAFDLCHLIKEDAVLKNVPVLFVMKEFNQDIALTGFDVGITDYIANPLSDADVLARVIWALQKNEDLKKIEKQEQLLSNLNVVYKNIGIYTQKFTKEVFKNEIDLAQKYKKRVCLMAVSFDNDFQGVVQIEKLAAIIKKSTRNSDIIGLADKKTFLVLMPKTSNEGAKIVYKRIQKALGDITASASSIEYLEEVSFEQLNDMVLKALEEALVQINSLKVVEGILPEEEDEEIEIPQELVEEIEEIESAEKSEEISQEELVEEPEEEIFQESQEVIQEENKEEKKDYKLFVQAYVNKVENVILPVFNQAKAKLEEAYTQGVSIKIQAQEEKCIFDFIDETTQNKASLKIINEGLSKLLIDVEFVQSGQSSNNSQKIDLKELNEEYLLGLLDKINEQFKGLINA